MCCVCLQSHFYYSCAIFTKVRYQYFMYLWFVCCWRRTTGVWHTGSCKLSIASAVMLFYLFRFANKREEFFHFVLWSCCCIICTWPLEGRNNTGGQELWKPEQNTIFIHYIHYIQCNTTRLSTHSLYPQSSAHWSESTSLKTPSNHPGVERRARWKEQKKKRKTENEKITLHPANIIVEDVCPKIAKRKVVFGIVFFFSFTKVLFN